MVGEGKSVPIRVKRLRGFPDREEVRQERRMDYKAFEGLWHRELNYKREHAAFKSQEAIKPGFRQSVRPLCCLDGGGGLWVVWRRPSAEVISRSQPYTYSKALGGGTSHQVLRGAI